MTVLEWFMLAGMLGLATMYLGDALNSLTASVRELLEVIRKDRP